MTDLEQILSMRRTKPLEKDGNLYSYKINLLYGLQDLILENLDENSIVCEIGSFHGASSMLFAYYCKQVYCVDYFNKRKYEEIFDKNTRDFKNIVKIKGESMEMCQTFEDEMFDLVYIDAFVNIHSRFVENMLCWMPKVKKGGFISGHDYFSIMATYTGLRELGIIPDKVYSDTSWIKRIEQ